MIYTNSIKQKIKINDFDESCFLILNNFIIFMSEKYNVYLVIDNITRCNDLFFTLLDGSELETSTNFKYENFRDVNDNINFLKSMKKETTLNKLTSNNKKIKCMFVPEESIFNRYFDINLIKNMLKKYPEYDFPLFEALYYKSNKNYIKVIDIFDSLNENEDSYDDDMIYEDDDELYNDYQEDDDELYDDYQEENEEISKFNNDIIKRMIQFTSYISYFFNKYYMISDFESVVIENDKIVIDGNVF